MRRCATATETDPAARLAYEFARSGTPVVFLPGLTFDLSTWQPIAEQLNGSVTSIVIDLPARGDSSGKPAKAEKVPEQVHRPLALLVGVRQGPHRPHPLRPARYPLRQAGSSGAAGVVLAREADENDRETHGGGERRGHLLRPTRGKTF